MLHELMYQVAGTGGKFRMACRLKFTEASRKLLCIVMSLSIHLIIAAGNAGMVMTELYGFQAMSVRPIIGFP